MRLRVLTSAKANKPAAVTAGRVVMRPVHYWRAAGIVDHLAAHLDAIADVDRTAGRDRNVVDDFDRPGRCVGVECFVHRVRSRAVEEVRRRRHRSREIDPRGLLLRVGAHQIHRLFRSRAARWRQERPAAEANSRAV